MFYFVDSYKGKKADEEISNDKTGVDEPRRKRVKTNNENK